jgi:RAB6A-GEF complex partner protein 2
MTLVRIQLSSHQVIHAYVMQPGPRFRASPSLKMAVATTTGSVSAAAGSAASSAALTDATGTRLLAQLSCKYIRPGGIVRGVVQLLTDHTAPDASTEIDAVVAQIHAHVSVDSNLLSVPVVVTPTPTTSGESPRGLSPTEIRKFSGESGACLYVSSPYVLLTDLNVAPTPSERIDDTHRRCRRDFALALPEGLCPTFRGSSARVFYVVSISVYRHAVSLTPPVTVHLPFDVYAREFSFAPQPILDEPSAATQASAQQQRRTSRKERAVSVAVVPVGVRKGSEIPFELRPSLMHGRIETEQLQRAQTSIFTIGKDDSHLVKLLLTKQFYHPGDVLLGVFDFSQASIPCLEISATLCLEEVLASMALQPNKVVQSKVVGAYHEYTASSLQTNVRFAIPHDAVPTIATDLVCFQWCIRFEFTASVVSDEETTPAAHATQIFKWQVPIDVQPSTARASSSFANVPHKLFTGSNRTVVLP